MADCPHCSKPIESLSGFVPQAKLEERIAAKNGEIQQLASKLGEVAPQAAKYDAVAAEVAEWRGKYEQVTQRIERTSALGAKGVSADLLDSIEVLYESAQAGVADGERKDFGAWLEADAPAHPLLASHFTPPPPDGEQPPTGDTGAQQPPPKPPGLPSTPGATAAPPPPQGKMTPQQTAAYFQTPAYRALKPEEKRAKLAELMSGS